MDHSAEQEMELEALEAILADDLTEYEGNKPDGWQPAGKLWRILVNPGSTDGEQQREYPLQLELVFAHTATYPDEPPLIRPRSALGLSDADIAEVQRIVEEQVESNLGMPCIYAVVAAAQDWLSDKAVSSEEATIDPKAAEKQSRAEEEAKLAAIRSHGVPVTADTFADWKRKFEAEAALADTMLQAEAAAAAERKKRQTGKQWFLAHDADAEDSAAASNGEEGEEGSADEEEDEDFDFSEEDDDDNGMLDEYLKAHTAEAQEV